MAPRRPHIDAALVRRLLTAQFPDWADRPVRPVAIDGWDNRTFHIGEDLSARLPSGDGYDAQVRKELDHLPTIANGVTLEVPEIVALGRPSEGYPFEWTVRRWIDGTPVRDTTDRDDGMLARDLAAFLHELRDIDPSGGPQPGVHSQGRGAPLEQWDDEVATAIAKAGNRIDPVRAQSLWAHALAASFVGTPRWFHGDVAVGNLLTQGGRLSAVIDFGCAGVGDPACDLAIAWSYFTVVDRERFRVAIDADDAMWRRGVGWALWKALISFDDEREGAMARHTLDQLEVLAPINS